MNIRIPLLGLLGSLFVAAAAYAAPELSVEQGVFNFGSIAQGKKVQHTFVIKNTGDATLQIRQLRPSCGCTAATPSSSQIPPGKSAEIKVVFDSTNFSGRMQKSVVVDTNAGKNPSYTLVMDGTVVEALQVSPRTLSLGAIKIGATREVSLNVTNRGNETVKLLSVNTTSPQIKASIKKGTIPVGESGTVEIAVTPQTEARVLSGYVHITTDNPQKKEITVPVYASPTK
ncbi:DUF1573 domain-containing protein [Geomonas sp. RF6]|uniref:DUF1573 domain-containing protein n=1 Tax=Geomonas sp. RF6 TaxID=2897342 RepID=UPI001E4D8BE6|nr:DUF1573 domain-containing protein [Geomonas sp. RF6]UFS70600.1 DUF1573 domain-containing protein [Geomonas sp. RF6]